MSWNRFALQRYPRWLPSSSRPLQPVFSLQFLKQELATAENIRDRSNRQAVLRCLRMMIAKLSTVSENDLRAKGFCLLAGIGDSGEEVCQFFVLPRPSPRKIYRCDSKFHLDLVRDCLEKEEKLGYLCVLTGKDARCFSITTKTRHLLFSLDVELVKRQRKGGQSSVRFSRLAEESRHNYIVRLADRLLPVCDKPLLVQGSRELSDDLVQYLTRKGCNARISQGDPTAELLAWKERPIEEKIMSMLERLDDDHLLFAPEPSRYNDLEYILCAEGYEQDWFGEKILRCGKGTRSYSLLVQLGGVAGWLYPGRHSDED